jgi:hypothetical protein
VVEAQCSDALLGESLVRTKRRLPGVESNLMVGKPSFCGSGVHESLVKSRWIDERMRVPVETFLHLHDNEKPFSLG